MKLNYPTVNTNDAAPSLSRTNPFTSSIQNQEDQASQYPTQPVDLQYTETITLDDVILGNEKSVHEVSISDQVDLISEILTNRDLLICKGFYFFFFAAFGSLFPLMGVYFKQMGMNSVQAGILSGVRPLIEFFSAPFWSSLADRFYKGKMLLLLSIFSWIVFTSALAYIRPPAAACVIFNETHHTLYTPYSDENDEGYEISVEPKKTETWTKEGNIYDQETSRSVLNRFKREHLNRYKIPPTHIIGKSPITIEYTLNYNKDIHSSYVSPPFSTIVYKWNDVESVFFLLWLLIILGEFFSAPAITLADSVTLEYLGDNIDNYGRQRMFGSIGWAISMFFVGMALDNSTEFTNHPCGPHESERNYKVCFTIFAILMSFAGLIAFQFKFNYDNSETRGHESDMPMKMFNSEPKSIFNTAPLINPPTEAMKGKKFEFLNKWKSAVFAQQNRQLPQWVEVLKTCSNIRYAAFLFVTWFMGAGIGLVFAFLFWHLQDLGGTPTLFGIGSVINHISEILAYFYSLRYIMKYGHTKVLCFGLICNILRFLYVSSLENPWWVLPFELIQGITHAAVWAACCSYITQATSPHLKSSTQGVLQGLHHGLGKGGGAILGGIFINKFGTRAVYATYGILSIFVLAFFIYVNYQRTDQGFHFFENQTEHHVFIEEGSAFAPQGVPSASITRVTSKVNLENGQNIQFSSGFESLEASKFQPVGY